MARSSTKRVLGTLFFVAALVAFLAFMFLLFADAENIDSVPGTTDMDPVAIGAAITMGVFALLILLLLVVRKYDKRQEDSDSAEAFFVPDEDQEALDAQAAQEFEDAFHKGAPDLIVYDLAGMQQQKAAWSGDPAGLFSYHFPRNIQAGVYANDYVEIGGGLRLKFRTLLAGPEAIGPGAISLDGDETDAPEEVLPGDDFMAELEERYHATKDTGDYENFDELEEPAEVVYAYQGDNHPVIDVEGIGPVYAEKLQQLGIKTTARLCYEETDELAKRLGTEAKRVAGWQAMAELMMVSGIGPQYAEALARAGLEGIGELKRRSPNAIAEQVNEYLDGLETNVLGSHISARRVEGWQEAAKGMRRVRSVVPAE